WQRRRHGGVLSKVPNRLVLVDFFVESAHLRYGNWTADEPTRRSQRVRGAGSRNRTGLRSVSMSMTNTLVLVLVGSLRADSLNRKIAEAVREQAPAGVTVDIADGLGDLPFYNEDIDGDAAPEAVVRLREQVAAA